MDNFAKLKGSGCIVFITGVTPGQDKVTAICLTSKTLEAKSYPISDLQTTEPDAIKKAFGKKKYYDETVHDVYKNLRNHVLKPQIYVPAKKVKKRKENRVKMNVVRKNAQQT